MNPYKIFHFLCFNIGGTLVKYTLARNKCRYGEGVRFFLGGGVINETGEKSRITIGKNTQIKGWLITHGKGKIDVGQNTIIHPRTIIRAADKIKIGDYCNIASDVYIEDHNNHSLNYKKRRRELKESIQLELLSKKITIGNDVWIGRRAMIFKGVSIGNGSIIAGGAVVTHHVPSNTIAAGNPAKIVKILN